MSGETIATSDSVLLLFEVPIGDPKSEHPLLGKVAHELAVLILASIASPYPLLQAQADPHPAAPATPRGPTAPATPWGPAPPGTRPAPWHPPAP